MSQVDKKASRIFSSSYVDVDYFKLRQSKDMINHSVMTPY